MSFRYKITIEYEGTYFGGWQRQENAPSIQGSIETALQNIFGISFVVEGAGRTDKGVHALGQVAHFDLNESISPYRLIDGLNHFLREHKVSILNCELVYNNFHARFSALSRTYVYRIINRRSALALEQDRAWHVIKPLDVSLMQQAAQFLVGSHDFSTFRYSECQSKSPIKTLNYFTISQENELITAKINSKSFLHNQVRIMIGTLKAVGDGTLKANDIPDILASKDRKKAGITAPACGLYLHHVEY